MSRLLVLVALVWAATAAAATPEDRLSQVFQAIEANQPDLALKRVDALITDYPNFRLAYLVRGDLLLARARPLRQRPDENQLPRYVLQLPPQEQHVFVVDSRSSRLYVFANEAGKPRRVADYYVTLGKNGVDKTREGDQKTPIGVYHITANLPKSKLTDFYGAGAFPINYPNEWDKRLGRNGHGIWLHGVPSDLYSRPPRASDGCIVLANPDLLAVGRYVQVGLTPVIIADEIEWVDAGALAAERSSLAAALEQWRADWQSRDTPRYLSHYSTRFSSGTENYATWAEHKGTVNASKKWITVGLSGVGMFRYPRERDFVVVTFTQDYRSNGLSNVMKKRQYWVKEDGRWKILYEGAG